METDHARAQSEASLMHGRRITQAHTRRTHTRGRRRLPPSSTGRSKVCAPRSGTASTSHARTRARPHPPTHLQHSQPAAVHGRRLTLLCPCMHLRPFRCDGAAGTRARAPRPLLCLLPLARLRHTIHIHTLRRRGHRPGICRRLRALQSQRRILGSADGGRGTGLARESRCEPRARLAAASLDFALQAQPRATERGAGWRTAAQRRVLV